LTMVDRDRLSTEEPKRRRWIVNSETPGCELRSTRSSQVEARVDTRLGCSHDLTRVGECRLRDRVVLRMELKCDRVSCVNHHTRWVKDGHILITNDNGHIGGRCDCGGSKGKSDSRETHFREDQRQWELNGLCVMNSRMMQRQTSSAAR